MARILYVEDDEHSRFVFEKALEGRHEVETVPGIGLASIKLSLHHYDLIICDGNLKHPEEGSELAARLHAEGQNVMIVSGDDDNRRDGIAFCHRLDWDFDTMPVIVERQLHARCR
jgi:CheY-like chemotaxis protein